MRCQYCGFENADTNSDCERCKAPLPSTGASSANTVSPQPTYGTTPPPPPQQYYQQGPTGPMSPSPSMSNSVPNYLPWAIAVTLCCCPIGGIVSIIYSSQATSKQAAGDYIGAQQAANTAKTWLIVGAILGFVTQALYIVIFGLSALSGMGNF